MHGSHAINEVNDAHSWRTPASRLLTGRLTPSEQQAFRKILLYVQC